MVSDADWRAAVRVHRGRLAVMRIGFLFNHAQIHQVAHSLPIALALARRTDFMGEIIIATTNDRIAAEVCATVTLSVCEFGSRRRDISVVRGLSYQ